MKNDKCDLLASIVLFGKLYNQADYDSIYDLIGLFIKAAIADSRTWSVNAAELTDIVNSTYGFQLPESIIRTTVRDHLRGIARLYGNGRYFFDPRIGENYQRVNTERQHILGIQQDIHALLFNFIEKKTSRPPNGQEKDTIVNALNQYLLDKDSESEHANAIMEFVLVNRKDPTISRYLTSIRAGLILYRALRFTPDPAELYQWKTPLIIFLSIEHLFNALEYNGKHFLHVFEDLHHLVQEINDANRCRGRIPCIQLRYLEETRDEFEQFFRNATAILNGEIIPDPDDPSRLAMEKLLKGCTSPSAIQEKKSAFIYDLARKGIKLYEFDQHIYNYLEYRVDQQDNWLRVRESITEKWGEPEDDRCLRLLRIFSIVNALRQERPERRLEEVRYVFLTNQRLGLYLTRETRVGFPNGQIPFAVDIDFCTNSLWMKLKKGFGGTQPHTLRPDKVARTQVVLPPFFTDQASEAFDSLLDKLEQGVLTTPVAQTWNNELRDKLKGELLPGSPANIIAIRPKKASIEPVYQENHALRKELELLRKDKERQTKVQKIKIYNEHRLTEEREFIAGKLAEWEAANRRDAGYAARIIGLSCLSFALAAFAAFCKINRRLNDWLSGIGNWLYLFIVASAVFSTAGLAGLTLFFDQKRVKNGCRWLGAHLSLNKKGYDQLKADAMERFGREFMANHPDTLVPEDPATAEPAG